MQKTTPFKQINRSTIFSIVSALLLLCVFGIKIMTPAMGYIKTAKEIATTSGESDEKTNSEKQTDNQDDFNKDKILSVAFFKKALISTETANASFSSYINYYLPTHHFTILSPPPDLVSVLKS